jgi:hypothetical protein
LEMIEVVDPEDRDALDEIDLRVFAYVNNMIFNKGTMFDKPYYEVKSKLGDFFDAVVLNGKRPFSRSRDALKAIRPKGWWFGWRSDGYCVAGDGSKSEKGVRRELISSSIRPTEELAELHAIIQAIAYERGEIL